MVISLCFTQALIAGQWHCTFVEIITYHITHAMVTFGHNCHIIHSVRILLENARIQCCFIFSHFLGQVLKTGQRTIVSMVFREAEDLPTFTDLHWPWSDSENQNMAFLGSLAIRHQEIKVSTGQPDGRHSL